MALGSQVSSLSGSIKAAAAQHAEQEAAARYQGQLSDLEVALSAAHGQHSSSLRDVGSALADFGLQPELAAAQRDLEVAQGLGRQHLEQGLEAVRAARQDIVQVRWAVHDKKCRCSAQGGAGAGVKQHLQQSLGSSQGCQALGPA